MAARDTRKILDMLVQESMDYGNAHNNAPEFFRSHIQKMIYHVMPDHPYANVHFMVDKMYECLVPEATTEQLKQAAILGWIFQMFQASFYMFDDMVDQDTLRFGMPTWSNLNNHQISAVSFDYLMLDSTVYYLLEKHFGHMGSLYLDMVCTFRQTRLEIGMSNRIETALNIEKGKRSNKVLCASATDFGLREWEEMAQLKASVFVKLPLLLAMALAGNRKEEQPEMVLRAEEVANKLGIFGYALDDYYDVFSVNQKLDDHFSDARRGTLSFLWVTAKELCQDEKEWMQFLDKYGRDDKECFQWIKDFFIRIRVPEKFMEYRKKLYKDVMQDINAMLKNHKGAAAALKWVAGEFHTFGLDEVGSLSIKLDF